MGWSHTQNTAVCRAASRPIIRSGISRPAQPQLEDVRYRGLWVSASLTAQEHGAKDFESVLAQFSERYPQFAGYTLDAEGAVTMRLVKHGGDLPGQRVGQIAKALKEVLETNPLTPALLLEDGTTVRVKRVKPEFVTVRHNFMALYKGKIKARTELLRTGLAASAYIRDHDGMLVVNAQDEQRLASLKQQVAALGYPDDMVQFGIDDARPEIRVDVQWAEPLSPVGGLRINGSTTDANYYACSIGTNVRFTGTANGITNPQGFLTARHCTPTIGGYDNHVFYQVGRRIGKEAIDPRVISQDTPGCAGNESGQVSICVRADVAFATYEVPSNVGRIARPFESVNQKEVTVTNGTPDTYAVTAVAPRPGLGSVVTKVGATTGWTKGRVTDDHVDIGLTSPTGQKYVVLDSVLMGRLNATDTYQLSAGGDSGSVWFIRNASNVNDYNVQLAGIHFAGNSNSISYFSPVENIRTDYAGLGSFTFCVSSGSC